MSPDLRLAVSPCPRVILICPHTHAFFSNGQLTTDYERHALCPLTSDHLLPAASC
ncbi:MAG: hypothetical protein PVJ11_09955 [Syntrophobacterales bacterium]|jgi:hypothetical protein